MYIKTKEDLKFFLEKDRLRYKKNNLPNWLGRFLGLESYHAFYIIKHFRKYEYAFNNKNSFIGKIRYLYRKLKFQRLSFKMKIFMHPNSIGYGLRIVHIGGGIIMNCHKIGNNCTVTSGVIIGNKNHKDSRPTIGDNVEITLGAKIIGKINVGNNVIIAPNSVVIKDVPENAIVSGIPAKIIKYKN